jgi:hypothetical protein
VNFNGTNGSIRANFNVSSVNKNGTGDYTINYTNSLGDTNYSIVCGGQVDAGSGGNSDATVASVKRTPDGFATGSSRIVSQVNSNTGGGGSDAFVVTVAVFR